MKGYLLGVAIICFFTYAHGQMNDKRVISGGWINSRIAGYYDSSSLYDCNINYFDNDKFLPLYLSFDASNQVKVAFRIEQQVFTYVVDYSKRDSVFIHRGPNRYQVFVLKNVLYLRYNSNLIAFTKVSAGYVSDIFGEFIKDKIFRRVKSYAVVDFKEGKKYNNTIINSRSFREKIKELFMCDQVEFVQLGSLKYGNTCVPEISLYYHQRNNSNVPRVLGIVADNDSVRLVDNAGNVVLSLKPS